MNKTDFETTSQIVVHTCLLNRITSLAPDSRTLFLKNIRLLQYVIPELTSYYSTIYGFTYTDSSIELEFRYIDELDAFVVIDFEFLSPDSPPPGDPVILVEFYQNYEDGAVLIVEEMPFDVKMIFGLAKIFSSYSHLRMAMLTEDEDLAHLWARRLARLEARASRLRGRSASGKVKNGTHGDVLAPPVKHTAGRQLHIGKSVRDQGWMENGAVSIQRPGTLKNTDILKTQCRIEIRHIENNIRYRSGTDCMLLNSDEPPFLIDAKETGKTGFLFAQSMPEPADPTSMFHE